MTESRTISPSEAGSIHPGTENMSAIDGVISVDEVENQTERLLTIFKNKKVCVLHDGPGKWQITAGKIHSWFHERSVHVGQVSYANKGWIEEVRTGQFTNFIFLGLPACDRKRKGPLRMIRPARSPTASDYSQMEYSYFSPGIVSGKSITMNINDVVVIVRSAINTKKDFKQKISGHYLEPYIILDGSKDPVVVSASALGIFAGTGYDTCTCTSTNNTCTVEPLYPLGQVNVS